MELIEDIGRAPPVGYLQGARHELESHLTIRDLAQRLKNGGWLICHPQAHPRTILSAPNYNTPPDNLDGLPVDSWEASYANWWAEQGAAVGRVDTGEIDWQHKGEYEELL